MCRLRLLLMTALPVLQWAAIASILDSTFELDPQIQGRIDVVRPVPDGSIYIGGSFTNLPDGTPAWLLRLTEQGALDPSFPPWKPTWASAGSTHRVRSIELDSQGYLWISSATYVPPSGDGALVPIPISAGSFFRIRPDRSEAEISHPTAADVRLTPQNGKALLWGSHAWVYSTGGSSEDILERRNLVGELDRTFQLSPGFRTGRGFDGPGSPTTESLSILADGTLLIAGALTLSESGPWPSVACLEPDGALRWFHQWAEPRVAGGVAAQIATGDILVAGFQSYGREGRLARLNQEGAEDLSYLGAPSFWGVTHGLIEPDGRVVLAGSFTHFLGVPRAGLVALLPDGSLDLGFDPGTGFTGAPKIRSLVRQEDGRILVLGDFTEFAGRPQRSLFRLKAADPEASATASNIFYLVSRESPWERGRPGRYAVVRAGRLDRSSEVRVWTVSQTAIAGLDFVPVDTLLSFAPGDRSKEVEVVALPDEIADGYETFGLELGVDPGDGVVAEPAESPYRVVDQPHSLALRADHLVADEATWVWVPGQFPISGDVSPFRFRLRTRDGTALAGRDYRAVDWTGEWARWPQIQILDNDDYDGNREFIVELTAVGGGVSLGEPSRTTVTIRDNDTLAGPSRGIVGTVRQLMGAAYSRWVVVGDFERVDGKPRPGLAQLLDDGTLDLSFTPPPDLDGPVWAAITETNGSMIIGGAFTRCGGGPVPGLVRLLRNGEVDPHPVIQMPSVPAPCSGPAPQVVQFLARLPDGRLWVAGSLPQFQGCGATSQVAVFDADGTWLQGWSHAGDFRIAALFEAPSLFRSDPFLVTQDGEIIEPDGSLVSIGDPLEQKWRFNRFLPVPPLIQNWTMLLPGNYGGIFRLAPSESGLGIQLVSSEVMSISGPLRFWLSSWYPLANGRVLMSGIFSSISDGQSGEFTGQFNVTDRGIRASGPLQPLAVNQLTVSRDGRWAGVKEAVGYGTVHLIRLPADGSIFNPLNTLRIQRVAADAEGTVHLALKGQAVNGHTLEVSGDLKSWSPLVTHYYVHGPNVFVDSSGTNAPGPRFYRVRY